MPTLATGAFVFASGNTFAFLRFYIAECLDNRDLPESSVITELEIPNDGDGQPDWRLYRVNAPAEEG